MQQLDSLKVKELQAELRKLGKSTSGLKAELQARLRVARLASASSPRAAPQPVTTTTTTTPTPRQKSPKAVKSASLTPGATHRLEKSVEKLSYQEQRAALKSLGRYANGKKQEIKTNLIRARLEEAKRAMRMANSRDRRLSRSAQAVPPSSKAAKSSSPTGPLFPPSPAAPLSLPSPPLVEATSSRKRSLSSPEGSVESLKRVELLTLQETPLVEQLQEEYETRLPLEFEAAQPPAEGVPAQRPVEEAFTQSSQSSVAVSKEEPLPAEVEELHVEESASLDEIQEVEERAPPQLTLQEEEVVALPPSVEDLARMETESVPSQVGSMLSTTSSKTRLPSVVGSILVPSPSVQAQASVDTSPEEEDRQMDSAAAMQEFSSDEEEEERKSHPRSHFTSASEQHVASTSVEGVEASEEEIEEQPRELVLSESKLSVVESPVPAKDVVQQDSVLSEGGSQASVLETPVRAKEVEQEEKAQDFLDSTQPEEESQASAVASPVWVEVQEILSEEDSVVESPVQAKAIRQELAFTQEVEKSHASASDNPVQEEGIAQEGTSILSPSPVHAEMQELEEMHQELPEDAELLLPEELGEEGSHLNETFHTANEPSTLEKEEEEEEEDEELYLAFQALASHGLTEREFEVYAASLLRLVPSSFPQSSEVRKCTLFLDRVFAVACAKPEVLALVTDFAKNGISQEEFQEVTTLLRNATGTPAPTYRTYGSAARGYEERPNFLQSATLIQRVREEPSAVKPSRFSTFDAKTPYSAFRRAPPVEVATQSNKTTRLLKHIKEDEEEELSRPTSFTFTSSRAVNLPPLFRKEVEPEAGRFAFE